MDTVSQINTRAAIAELNSYGAKFDASAVELKNKKDYLANNEVKAPLDLSNYYNDDAPKNLLSRIGSNVVQSANKLEAMFVRASQNGYSVHDAYNLKMANFAYRANQVAFDTVSKLSTFEVDVE